MERSTSKADAEDIVQDVFVKVIEKHPIFQFLKCETAWPIRVTVKLCESRLRSGWRKKTAPLIEPYPAQTEEQKHLMETILLLPAKYRVVIPVKNLNHLENRNE